MIEILYLTLILGSAYILGYYGSNIFKISFKDRLENIIFSVGIGLALLSFIVFGLGIFGVLLKSALISLLVGLNAILVVYILKIKPKFCLVLSKFTKIELILAGIICVASILHIVYNFLPTGDSDSLAYHLTLPKYFAQENKIFNTSTIVKYSTFPQLVEMLYALALVLRDEVLAQQIHLVYAFLTTLLIYFLGKKYFSRKTGLLAAAFFILSTTVQDLSGSAMVDFALTFYFLLTFAVLMKWFDSSERKWFFLAAVLSGIVCGVKYSAILVFILPIAFYFALFLSKKAKFDKTHIFDIIKYGLMSALVISPWLIRNYIFTDNPFSPFLAKIFDDKSMNPWLVDELKRHLDSCRNIVNPLDYFKYIFRLFFDTPQLFLVFAVFFFRNSARIYIFMVAGFIYLVGAVLMLPLISRFFLPAFPLLFLVSSEVIIKITDFRSSKYIRIPIIVIISGIIGYGVLSVGNKVFRKENFSYLSGQITKYDQMCSHLEFYSMLPQINSILSRDDKILSLNDTRAYYFDQKVLVGYNVLDGYIAFNSSDLGEIVKGLKDKGINYIFTDTAEYWQEHQRKTILTQEVLDKEFELIASNKHCFLYRISK